MAQSAKRKQGRRVALPPPSPPPPPPLEEETVLRTEVENELRRLANEHDGRLTPDIVIEAATDEQSPLHAEFTWHDATAAALRRIDEARRLIRSVKLIVTNEVISFRVPAYIRDQSVPAKQQGYIAIARVRSETDLARETAVREFSRAVEALTRAQAIANYLGIVEEVATVRRLIDALARQVGENRQPGNAD